MTSNASTPKERLVREILSTSYFVAFTGAGISQESGIPTYRGKADGLWKKYDPAKYASIDSFLRDPSYYWNFFKDVRYPSLKQAKPNKGHRALAELEKIEKLKALITQNIDGLHQEAGSNNVIELHGNSRRFGCLDCPAEYTHDDAYSMLKEKMPPECPDCGGLIKPKVVLFGEKLSSDTISRAVEEAERSDLLLAVGSSLTVYPAAGLIPCARERGGKVAIINKEKTPLDSMFDLVVYGKAGELLPEIVEGVLNGGGD